MPFNPFSALTSKIFAGTSLALMLACAFLWLKAEHWHNVADKWQLAQQKMEVAAQANAQLAEAQVRAAEARSAEQARENENAYQATLTTLRGQLGTYVDRMRLDKVCGRSTTTAPQGSDPRVPLDLPPNSDLVAISKTNLQELVDWLAVGVEAHNGAVKKIEDGTAVPDPTFGK